MKLIFSLLLVALLTTQAAAQTIPANPNKTDKQGLRQGKWTLLFDAEWSSVTEKENAVYYRLIEYKNDKPVGLVRDYYPSGKVQWEGSLLQDRPEEIHDGQAIWYREDGTKEILKIFDNGNQIKETWFNGDGSEDIESWGALDAMGWTAYRGGNITEAATFFEKAYSRAEIEFGNSHPNHATAMNNLAISYNAAGSYAKAEQLFKSAVDIIGEKLGKEHPEYASALLNLAGQYYQVGKYNEAMVLALEAKDIREKVLGKEHPDYAASIRSLAILYSNNGLFEQAEPLYIESKNIREKTLGKAHPHYATAVLSLAFLYRNMGFYEKSEPLYLESKTIQEKLIGKTHPDYATTLNSLGELYYLLGFYSKAEPLFIEAIAIRKAVLGGEHPYYAASLSNLAILYHRTGNFKTAEQFFIEARNVYETTYGINHQDYAAVVKDLGDLYRDMGFYKKAEPLLTLSKEIWKELLGNEHPNYTASLTSLAMLYDCMGKDKDKDAERLYTEIVNTEEKTSGKDHPGFSISLFNLALFYSERNMYEKAIIRFNDATETTKGQIIRFFPGLSESERELFYSSLKTRFEYFDSFSITAPGVPSDMLSEVYNIRLATKALLFITSNKVRQQILNSKNDSLIYLYKDWQRKRDELGKAFQLSLTERKTKNIDITVLEAQINQKEKQLSLQSQAFATGADRRLYTWQDVQKRLRKNEAAVELIRFRKSGVYKIVTDSSDTALPHYPLHGLTDTVYYAALIITRTSQYPETVLLKNGNDLEGRFLKNYKNRIKFKTEDTLSYSQFWKPIAIALNKQKIKKIFLSPDGAYNSVNLNTLQNPQTGKYLMDELDIQLVTNTKDLITQKTKIRKNKETSASLFGYPDYSGQDTTGIDKKKERTFSIQLDTTQRFLSGGVIKKLPGTKTEVQTVTELLKTMNIKVVEYLDNQATEEELKMLDNPKILHIATHGFFLQDVTTGGEQTFVGFDVTNMIQNPLLRSGLLLTNAQKTVNGQRNPDQEDGILTAYEAMNLTLDETDLVVLSACETGLGEIKNGEGVYGLQRAFQTAGVKSVLMSLWNVDDTATQELMITFYKNWLKGSDKRTAFNKAQHSLRSKYPHPYYWGAFVLVGSE